MPSPTPADWTGWRREQGSWSAAWEEVVTLQNATRGQVYERLMQLSELVAGHGNKRWEYAITPVGEQPKTDDGGRSFGRQIYSDRMMRGRK